MPDGQWPVRITERLAADCWEGVDGDLGGTRPRPRTSVGRNFGLDFVPPSPFREPPFELVGMLRPHRRMLAADAAAD